MIVFVHRYRSLLHRGPSSVEPVQLRQDATVADAVGDLGGVDVMLRGRLANAGDAVADGDHLHVGPTYGDPGTIVLAVIAVASAAASILISRSLASALPNNREANEQRRFGFGRFSNDARAGDVISVPYGFTPRYGGKVIARIPVEDPLGSGDSKLRILIAVGHGEIEAIGNQSADFDDLDGASLAGIFLNDQEVSGFADVVASGRMGAASQTPIRGFDDFETLRDVGVGGTELRNTLGTEPTDVQVGDAVTYTTSGDVDAVRVRVRFSGGLYELGGGNQLDPRPVQFRTRYRVNPAGAWSAWRTWTITQSIQSEFFASPLIELPATDTYDVQVQRITVETDPTDPTAVDKMLFDSVVEIVDADESYDGIALLALTITANDQVQTVPRVSFTVSGRKIRTYTGGGAGSPSFSVAYSNNPAAVWLDFITDTTYGLGSRYSDADVNFESWIEWFEYCEESITFAEPLSGETKARHAFDFVMQDQRPGDEWLRVIARAGRAIPFPVGNEWRFVVQRPQAIPVEVFGDGDIAADEDGTLLLTYRRELATGLSRPNQLQLGFENATQDGLPDVAVYPDEDGDLAGSAQWLGPPTNENVRTESGRLEGITDPDRALAETVFRMRSIRFRSREIEFTVTHPWVAVQPGDRFDLQSSLPGYGVAGGRVLSGSSTSAIYLDDDVTLDDGSAYSLQIVHLDESTETRPIDTIGVVRQGMPIRVAPSFSTAPLEGASYQVTKDSLELKPYECTRVEPEGEGNELVWRIAGLEYVEGVFDPDPTAEVVVPDYSTLRDPTIPPGPVFDLRVYDRLVQRPIVNPDGTPGVQYVNEITLSWQQQPEDSVITSTFRVFRRVTGTSSWVRVPEPVIAGRTAVVDILDRSRGYQFAVIAVSVWGSALSPNDPRVPVVSLAFNSQTEPPDAPSPITITRDSVTGGYTLSWAAVTSPVEAVEYQVLAGRDQDAQINAGSFDCFVLGRTTETSFGPLFLSDLVIDSFFVRSVGANGRLSYVPTAAVQAFPAALPGRAFVNTTNFNLSGTGVRTNLTHVASPSFNNATQTARLELTDPASAGVYESPEVDLGSVADTVLTAQLRTGNDTDDVAINTDPLTLVPGIEADQWGVVTLGKFAGMLSPPWPDAVLDYSITYRYHDGVSWSAWLPIAHYASANHTLQRHQWRVTLTRTGSPYRPSLAGLLVSSQR